MSYPGAKGQDGVFQRIIGQMPPHSMYIEPFAGSAQIFFRKRPAAANVLIEVASGAHASLVDACRQASAQIPLTASHVIHGDAFRILPALSMPVKISGNDASSNGS